MCVRSWTYGSMWCDDCFFFFQAEDGIRDSSVTGVQTCALPISGPKPAIRLSRKDWPFGTNRASLCAPNRTHSRFGILPRRLHGHCGASVVTAGDAVAHPTEEPREDNR